MMHITMPWVWIIDSNYLVLLAQMEYLPLAGVRCSAWVRPKVQSAARSMAIQVPVWNC